MVNVGHAVIETGGRPIKAWIRGLPEHEAWIEGKKIEHVNEGPLDQLRNLAALPFIHSHVAAMPDVHVGIGATVGSVIPTIDAIIPAAVGVDIGCGMMAAKVWCTSESSEGSPLKGDRLTDLPGLRSKIERAVPHGGPGVKGSWEENGVNRGYIPREVIEWWGGKLSAGWQTIIDRHPKLMGKTASQLGTLGTGNHFVEICLDEEGHVWIMLHSGSRGAGNRIGTYFIEKAREEMKRWFINLPDRDLAYLPEGSQHFADYVMAVNWAQEFAALNRRIMFDNVMEALQDHFRGSSLTYYGAAINCHHNYVRKEHHFGRNVWLTRKGAVSAREGELGIIPGSMGAQSFIVKGKGDPMSFSSCSHGAGRRHGRNVARKLFTLDDHRADTEGVECLKDASVLDETPKAYKDIHAVMAAQSDLVDVVHVLKQVVCVKG